MLVLTENDTSSLREVVAEPPGFPSRRWQALARPF